MNTLDYNKLECIKNDYDILTAGMPKGAGIDLRTFIKIMTEHFSMKKDPIGIVRNLVELFEQIDVNDDKSLEWVEFTNYIIELGMVRKDRNLIDAIKCYLPDNKIKASKHEGDIENMYYLDKLNHLLVMEKDAKTFKVFNSMTGKQLYTVPPTKLGNSGAFIAADYIDKYKLVATTSNNNAIDFWDANNYQLKQQENTPEIQLCSK